MAPTASMSQRKPSDIPHPPKRQRTSLATEDLVRACDRATPTNAASQILYPSKDYPSPETEGLVKFSGVSPASPTNNSLNCRSTSSSSDESTTADKSAKSDESTTSDGTPPMAIKVKELTKVRDTAPAPTSTTLHNLSCSSPHWTSQTEPEWTRLPAEEPLPPGMKEEVRMNLKEYHHFFRTEIYRREIRASWVLEPCISELSDLAPARQVHPTFLERLCNKPTSLYWAQSAQPWDRCPSFPFGCIYTEWSRYHDDDPNIEFGHFFANLVRVTSTGPTTTTGILEAHKYFCDQASSLLSEISRGEACDVYPYRWPNPQHYRLLPLCRAIIVILDELFNLDNLVPDIDKDVDGFALYDKVSHKQNVIMVRTGDESCLSAPISFESISAQCLPLDRSDITVGGNIDAVRVSVATAVRFIADLQRREEAAFPNSGGRSVLDTSLCPSTRELGYVTLCADAWADKLIQKAEEEGFDKIYETRAAVRRVKAAKRGEVVDELTPDPFNNKWK